MKITLNRIDDQLHFEGQNEEGNTVSIDGGVAIGGTGKGMSPM